MKLPAIIEAILFYRGEPVSLDYLSKTLKIDAEGIKAGLKELEERLEGRGLKLVVTENEVALGTDPALTDLIESLDRKEKEYEEPSRAALETLTVILYRGPVSKTDIDYLRGVNSYFTLRQLMTRGLVEKIEDKEKRGVCLYKPTLELLANLGVTRNFELPNYVTLNEAFK